MRLAIPNTGEVIWEVYQILSFSGHFFLHLDVPALKQIKPHLVIFRISNQILDKQNSLLSKTPKLNYICNRFLVQFSFLDNRYKQWIQRLGWIWILCMNFTVFNMFGMNKEKRTMNPDIINERC